MKKLMCALAAAAALCLSPGCATVQEVDVETVFCEVVVPVMLEQGAKAAKEYVAKMLDAGQIDAEQAVALSNLIDKLAEALKKQAPR